MSAVAKRFVSSKFAPSFIPSRVPSLSIVKSHVCTGQTHQGVANGPNQILAGGQQPHVPLEMILGLTNKVDVVGGICSTVQETFQACSNAARRYDRVLTLGGDHSVALGTVGAQLLEHRGNLGVLWVDAHADINTKHTSTTGNSHGMVVSRLMGLDSVPWMGDHFPILDPSQIVYLGLNSVDPPEKELLDALGVTYITASEVKNMGVTAAMDLVDDAFDKFDAFHVSFDVDVCGHAMGTGTPDGILSIEETVDVASEIRHRFGDSVCGVDMVEVNTHDFYCKETITIARNVITEILK